MPRLDLARAPHDTDYWKVQFPFERTGNPVFLEIGSQAWASMGGGTRDTPCQRSVLETGRRTLVSTRAEIRASTTAVARRHHPESACISACLDVRAPCAAVLRSIVTDSFSGNRAMLTWDVMKHAALGADFLHHSKTWRIRRQPARLPFLEHRAREIPTNHA